MGLKQLLSALLLVACSDLAPPVTEYPSRPRPVDAGTPADCASACNTLRRLGCEEGNSTPTGASCETVCENVEASGVVTLDPVCVTGLTRCEDLEACSYGN